MGNMTLEQVNDMYLDVLREIGNIGAGNATSAIANMLGMKIDMNVPSIRLMEVSQLGMAVGAEDETIVGIFLEVETDIEGSMMFLLDIEPKEEEPESLTVVIVQKGENLAGLVVDNLIGQQEIVIKSLGKYINNNKIISGATILGDGEVALILDVNVLM